MQHGHGHTLKMEWQGGIRKGLLYEPPDSAGQRLPLVVALHGTGGSSRTMAHLSGLNRLGEERGFRVLYPQALGVVGTEDPAVGAAWNVGAGLGCPQHDRVDEVGFLRALVARVAQQAPVLPERIYVVGFSNGARMAYRMALEASSWVAAVAAVAGAPVWGPKPERPVPTLAFHGTEDRHIPYGGGVGPLGRAVAALLAPAALAQWAALMGCAPQPVEDSLEAHQLRLWTGPEAEVGLWTVAGQGHAWPGGKPYSPSADRPVADLSAAHLIWAFFEAHALEQP